ncbi:MAG TPA: hypothetical protein ENI99_01245 [Sedimenticola sp.]|nr:hypothetical protein [Sedimenticola sp.]
MNNFIRKGLAVCFGSLMTAAIVAPVAAEEIQLSEQAAVAEIEIDRGPEELQAVLRPRPDLDTTDTALVFNNALHKTAVVRCVAFGANGHALGRVRIKIPGNGLRFIRASDLANGLDFIGSARCSARGKIVPSAFIVGRILTDTPAKAAFDWPVTRMRFPAIATF